MQDMYRFVPALVLIIMCMMMTSSHGQLLRTRYPDKKSIDPLKTDLESATACPRCFNNEGHCVGRGVCCLKNNCIVGSIAAKECAVDGCLVPGEHKPCGGSGKCYVDGVCCEKDGCKMDDSCSSDNEKLIDLLKRLLSYERPAHERR